MSMHTNSTKDEGKASSLPFEKSLFILHISIVHRLQVKARVLQVDPRAAELAAGRRPEKKCGLAAGKNAASRQPGRKKYPA